MKRLITLWLWSLIGLLASMATDAQNSQVPKSWSYVATGDGSTYAIGKDGSLWSWGWNESGQLGIGGGKVKISVPQDISGGQKWRFVTSGQAYSFFIRQDGTLWAVGDNSKGVSGVGDGQVHKTLTQVGRDSDWASIAVTRFFGHSAFGIKQDGTLWAWGEGENGSLGLGNYKNVSTPKKVGTDSDWKQVSVGQYFTLAIKTDGSLWGWGWNQRSQLLNNPTHVKTPIRLGQDSDWREIFAVAEAVYGIKNDGSLYVWGYGEYGILGLGNPQNHTVKEPTRVTAVQGYVHAITGSEKMRLVCISPNGDKNGPRKLLTWGTNEDGALGDGTGVSAENQADITFTTIPVEVKLPKAMTIDQIAGGEGFAVVLNSDGELWGWGKNRGGQLGDYSTEDQMTFVTRPIKVATKGGGGVDDTVLTFSPSNMPASLKNAVKIVLEGEWSTADFSKLTSILGNNSGFPPAGNSTLKEVDMSRITIAQKASFYVPFGVGDCGLFQGCRALEKFVMPVAEQAAKLTSLRSAFQNCQSLKEIDLSGCVNITSLKDAFFGCAALTKIDLSACDKVRGTESMFDRCASLQEIVLPSSMTLEKYAFGGCLALNKIDWSRYAGEKLPIYPRDLFQYITDLKKIKLLVPASLYDKFSSDPKWGALTIEKAKTATLTLTPQVGKLSSMLTDEHRQELEHLKLEGGAMDARDFAQLRKLSKLSTLKIKGVKILAYRGDAGTLPGVKMYPADELPARSFAENSSLVACSIEGEVVSLGEGCFEACTALESIELGEGLKELSGSNFKDCTALRTIMLPSSVDDLGGSAFEGCTKLEQVVLPQGLKEIGGAAFKGCTALKSIPLPEALEEIGASAFEGCLSLEEVVLPSSTKSIGAFAFSDCRTLKGLTLPAGVKELDYGALLGCSALSSLVLPEGFETLGAFCLQQCDALRELRLPSSLEEIKNGAFRGTDIRFVLPDGSLFRLTGSLLMSQDGKVVYNLPTSYQGDLVIPQGVEMISGAAMSGCLGLRKINLPSSLKAIKLLAMEQTGLVEIHISVLDPAKMTLGEDIFGEQMNYGQCDLLVPKASLELYQATEPWRRFRVKAASSLEEIKAEASLRVLQDGSTLSVSVSDRLLGQTAELYNLQGYRLLTMVLLNREECLPVAGLTSGLYILRVGQYEVKIKLD